MKILHLRIKSKWFIDMIRGLKHEEYRVCSPYWESRLWDKQKDVAKTYDEAWITNGYGGSRPFIRRKIDLVFKGDIPVFNDNCTAFNPESSRPGYIIRLGSILEVRNYPSPGTGLFIDEISKYFGGVK